MKSSIQLFASLLVSFTTFSQAAVATTESKQYACNKIINQVKSQLLLEGYGQDVYITKDTLHTSVPSGRPNNITFAVKPGDESGDPRKGNKQLQFSRNIISKCHQISSVTFYVSGTDFQSTYGIVDGRSRQFGCYYFTASGERIPWGYNLAHARCSMKR